MNNNTLPSKVTIWEVLPRDGFQVQKKKIPTEKKISIIHELADTGIKNIEATSFVHPKAIPQLEDAEKVIKGTQQLRDVNFRALVPNVIGAERAISTGINSMKLMLSSTDSHCLSNLNCTIEEAKEKLLPVVDLANQYDIHHSGSLTVAFGCPYEGDVSVEKLISQIEFYKSVGIYEVSLADTTGMGNPLEVADKLSKLYERFPEFKFSLHLHNTRGMAFSNALAGLYNGVTSFDSSTVGLGGCPYAPDAAGNISTEDLVHGLHEMDIQTGVDLDKLMILVKEYSQFFNQSDGSFLLKAGQNKDLHLKPKGQTKLG